MAGQTVVERMRRALASVVRPPDLMTDEERSASRLELFFDLAFVLVVAVLAIALREDVTLHGTLEFAGRAVVHRAVETTLVVQGVADYLLTGHRVPSGWIWRKLTRTARLPEATTAS